MTDDDEVRDDESPDPTFASSGPRRSTFTPPTGATELPAQDAPAASESPADADASDEHDDDELANALAADFTRVASGPITVVPTLTGSFPAIVADAEPAGAAAEPDPAPVEPPPTPAVPADAPPAQPPAPSVPADAPPAQPPAPSVPAWANAPAPAPEAFVEGPRRPTRRSLPDEELMQTLDEAARQPGGTLNLIEHLESQLRLREEEAREFHTWEATMLSLGTPEAVAAVEETRPEFTGVLPPMATSSVLPPLVAEPPADAAPVDLGPAEPNLPEPAVETEPPAPEPAVETPATESQVYDLPVFETPVADHPEAAVPEPVMPAFDPDAFPRAEPFVEPVADVAPQTYVEQPEPDFVAPEFASPLSPDSAPTLTPAAEPEVSETETPPADELTAEPSGESQAPFAPDLTLVAEEPERIEQQPEAPSVAEPAAEPLAEPVVPEVSEFDRLFQDSVQDEALDEVPASQTWVIDADPVSPEPAAPLPPLIEPPTSWNAEPAPAGLLPEPVDAAAEPIGIDAATVEPDFASMEPQYAAEPESEPLPELVVESEPEPVPEPEEAAEPLPPVTDSPFTPPPLVEPPKYGLPPVTDPFAPVDTADTVTTDVQAPAADVPAAASAFSFEELLSGEVNEEPARADETPTPETDAAETIFLEPLPVLDADAVPVTTGSISVIDQAYEEELPDDVDETDRAFVPSGPVSVDTAGIAIIPAPIAPPSGPISTIRIAPEAVVLADNEPKSPGAFSLEESGLEPTPLDQRVGRAARLFWLWFAANSSVISAALGAVIFSLGISLRQAIVAALAGVAISFLPLGLGTLAGKRSGLPTMVVSRATFGLVGNILPALLALVTRLFWGAALLWILAISVSAVLTGGRISGGLSEFQLTIIALAIAFLLALLIAFVGYHLIARIQLILSILSGVLVVGLIVLTANRISISTALTTPDGPWILAVTGAVLVFSFVGLVWANSGADIARYQRFNSSGAGSMLWATFGATLPAFALIAYGALLAASDPALASALVTNPIGAIAGMLPLWYPIPLIAAVGLSLLSGVIITLYSGGFALQAIGIRAPRQWSIVIVGVLLLGLAFLLVLGVGGGIQELVRDVATTLAVPTAAWAGIFAAELMIRNRRFETDSLLKRGGVYPDVRWLNLPMLIIITVVGLGFTSATVGWLGWEGYLFTAIGVPLDGDVAGSDLGVLVALVLGLLTPILGGIPAIRKQESMRV